jgi:CubicO group peptidase (beta-lactamase class C family)
MLSAIVQKVTGMTVLDYLKPRLFAPLGIDGPTWIMSPQGVTAGAYGLSLRTEDIARFGQLYSAEGKVERQTTRPGAVDRRSNCAADVEWFFTQQRLGPGIWLSILAFAS